MKKIATLLVSSLLLISLFLVSPQQSQAASTVNITFDDGHKKIVKKYKKNAKINLNYSPKSPFKDKKYHWFSGWYTNKSLTNSVYSAKATKNKTFYGKWYTLNDPKISVTYNSKKSPVIHSKRENKFIREMVLYRASSKNGTFYPIDGLTDLDFSNTNTENIKFIDKKVKKGTKKTYYYSVSAKVFTGTTWVAAYSKPMKLK